MTVQCSTSSNPNKMFGLVPMNTTTESLHFFLRVSARAQCTVDKKVSNKQALSEN